MEKPPAEDSRSLKQKIYDIISETGKGISTDNFYNHPELRGYSIDDIDEIINEGRWNYDIVVGGVANRFFANPFESLDSEQ